ncbi:Hypothetical protein SMAX5B_011670 [Scophthalmus maximus]|uniref:Ig-like domain-containing protein n=2 Tax=Scophthalmus maximus TaxID=52904 RepID=A0A2U9AZC6_SCOMX|nr:uncharacterized protein LOC118319693 isoform X2 [Scophthalmus maximus]AWO96986.1 Hypothetical protein SMAX5B_011670 [Scophthalmus maximus]
MEMKKKAEISPICLLLLTLLQITTPSLAQNATTTIFPVTTTTTTTITSAADPAALGYSTRPADVTVALGEPAVFSCGVPDASPGLSFTFYGSHGSYTLTCPGGHLEDVPQALYGGCDMKNGESLAVWTLRGASVSDNGTRVVCQQSNTPDTLVAVLHVYDNGASYAVLIGCAIGAFFGILLVCALSYTMLWRPERCRKCLGAGETEDDMVTIVAKNSKETEN